jgi:hypothetical protein
MIKEEDEDDESDVEGVTNSLGVLKVDANKGQSMYLGDSHWHLVLADVSDILIFPPPILEDLLALYTCIGSSQRPRLAERRFHHLADGVIVLSETPKRK